MRSTCLAESVGRLSVGRLSVERHSVERLSVGRLSVERLSVGRLSVERHSVERLSVERLSVEQHSVERLASTETALSCFGRRGRRWRAATVGRTHLHLLLDHLHDVIYLLPMGLHELVLRPHGGCVNDAPCPPYTSHGASIRQRAQPPPPPPGSAHRQALSPRPTHARHINTPASPQDTLCLCSELPV
jgi:hypothetical protein